MSLPRPPLVVIISLPADGGAFAWTRSKAAIGRSPSWSLCCQRIAVNRCRPRNDVITLTRVDQVHLAIWQRQRFRSVLRVPLGDLVVFAKASAIGHQRGAMPDKLGTLSISRRTKIIQQTSSVTLKHIYRILSKGV